MQKAEGKQRLSTTGLKSHRNSIIFKGNINDSSPKGESPNTRKNLFSRRKKSLGDLQTNRTYTKQTSIRRDNHIHNELQEFLEHYSKNINLRRISESNHQKKSLEKLHFQSPLIKDKKSEFDNYEFNKITTEQKKIIKPVSHLKQKLQIFIEKFQRKKMIPSNNKIINQNPLKYDNPNIAKKELFDPNPNRINWDEINIPLCLNRHMLQKTCEEENDLLREYFSCTKKKKNVTYLKDDPSELLLKDLLKKNGLDQRVDNYVKVKNRLSTDKAIDSFISPIKKSFSKRNEIESPQSSTKVHYTAAHNEGATITIYSENTTQMQKKLLEKMELDRIITQNNIKLGSGQIKYVKNGRIYIFNLNENVILHKDKIIQIENKSRSEYEKLEKKDDLLNVLRKKNVSPTEYFCKKIKKI